jgi:opacity protein-like surface antigen
MRKVGLLLFLTALVAVPAMGQDEYPKAEVFGGFSYVRSGGVNYPGWAASVAANFHKNVGVVGDFAGFYKSVDVGLPEKVKASAYEFMFGPRLSVRGEKATGFVHVLFGGINGRAGYQGVSASLTYFGMAFGGGVDVNVSKHVAIRVAQLDVVTGRIEGTWARDFRYEGGVVFKFGGK